MKARQYLTARKKHHVIYKTTCLVTGRYYIGMHSTDDLDDGYLGSGKRLWYSLNKHGREQHRYEIIEHLPSREALRAREAELVTEELINDPMCMNLTLGGGHGWDHVNSLTGKWLGYGNFKNPEVQYSGVRAHQERRRIDPDYAKRHGEALSVSIKAHIAKHGAAWTGRQHTNASKQKMSAAKVGRYDGSKNPSAGRPWMYNEELGQCRKVAQAEIDGLIQLGWKRGRKMFT